MISVTTTKARAALRSVATTSTIGGVTTIRWATIVRRWATIATEGWATVNRRRTIGRSLGLDVRVMELVAESILSGVRVRVGRATGKTGGATGIEIIVVTLILLTILLVLVVTVLVSVVWGLLVGINVSILAASILTDETIGEDSLLVIEIKGLVSATTVSNLLGVAIIESITLRVGTVRLMLAVRWAAIGLLRLMVGSWGLIRLMRLVVWLRLGFRESDGAKLFMGLGRLVAFRYWDRLLMRKRTTIRWLLLWLLLVNTRSWLSVRLSRLVNRRSRSVGWLGGVGLVSEIVLFSISIVEGKSVTRAAQMGSATLIDLTTEEASFIIKSTPWIFLSTLERCRASESHSGSS